MANNQQARGQNGEHVRPLSDMSNGEILDAIRNESSMGFQSRIPASTQGDVQESLKTMFRIPALRNEFYDALVNRICGMYINELSWDNPLSEFKRANQNYGDIWEEVAMGLVQAQAYDENSEYLAQDIYGTYKLPVQSVFHHVNRDDYYGITIREASLKRAFTSDDGLSKFVAQLMETPRTSDQTDEFLLMTQLFTEYAKMGGYYRVHTPDISNPGVSQDEVRQMLRLMQTWVMNVPAQPSNEFNPKHMTTVTRPEDLIFFVTPEVQSALNVLGYASLFNDDRAETNKRTIVVRAKNFGINGVQAILTTRQFFFCYDTIYETANSQVHPISLGTNMFLRHQEALSVSPFAPALLFWTGEGTREHIVLPEGVAAARPDFQLRLSGFGLPAEKPENVSRGDMVQVVSEIKVANDPTFKPKGIVYTIKADKELSDFTRISNRGVLVCGPDEQNTEIKVQAKATYIDPTIPEVENESSAELTVPVVGQGALGFTFGLVTSLTIEPSSTGGTIPSVAVGSTQSFKAWANMTDGRKVDATNLVKWTVEDPSKGSIEINGVYTAKAPGNTVVDATVFMVDATTQVTNTGTATRMGQDGEGQDSEGQEDGERS